MKIAFTSKNISPEVGGRIAGYGPDDFTTAKHDDLYLSALALNDGKHTCIDETANCAHADEQGEQRDDHPDR